MVDVYHEFSHPKEMLESIVEALKPSGKIFLIEYRKENKWVPIKEVHKMSEAQAVKEFEAAGLQLMKNEGNLPWQHCMVFEKRP
jgi:ubiquinone/menaquinone biosynthesis C-methylase UbiE